VFTEHAKKGPRKPGASRGAEHRIATAVGTVKVISPIFTTHHQPIGLAGAYRARVNEPDSESWKFKEYVLAVAIDTENASEPDEKFELEADK
jgi:hypothetical protein